MSILNYLERHNGVIKETNFTKIMDSLEISVQDQPDGKEWETGVIF